MIGPTARQLEIAEAMKRHRGNAAAAARELGVSQPNVVQVMHAYQAALVDREALKAEVRAEVLAEMGDTLDRAESLASYLLELVGRIERAVVPVSHRRIADGGEGARRQRRGRRVA